VPNFGTTDLETNLSLRTISSPHIVSFSPDSNTVGDGVTDASSLTLTGTAVATDHLSIYNGTTLVGTTTADANGAWSFTTPTLSDGTYSFVAADTTVGTTSSPSNTLTVAVDTQAPSAPVIQNDATSVTNQEALSGTAEANSTVTVFDGTAKLGTTLANSSGAWSFTTGSLVGGSHVFTASATDVAGNTSAASAPLTAVIPTATGLDSNGHFSGVPTVTLTPGTYNLTHDMVVTNENLVVNGCTFTGPGQIILSGTASLTGSATLSNGWGGSGAVLIEDSGAYSVQGLNFQNVSALSCISIIPSATTTISSLSINENTFSDSNYGILRTGGLGQINATTITNNTISNMEGDGIELNVIPNDNNALIANNHISQINNTQSNPDWGIAIGVAGASYSSSFANGAVAQNFVIEGNTISGAVQGIHVEAAQHFTIQDNTISNISASYSANSGLEEAGIVTYGSGQFSVLNNTVNVLDNGPGIYLAPGVLSGEYVGEPVNFTVSQNVLNSGISGILWADTGTSVVTNNVVTGLDVFGGISSNILVASNGAASQPAPPPTPAAPVVASFSPDSNIAGDGITNVNHVTLSGTATANTKVEVFDGTTQLGSATVDSNGNWSFATGQLADGTHKFSAEDLNGAGTAGPASNVLNVVVDTKAPVVSEHLVKDSGSSSSDGITFNPALTGSADANAVLTLKDGAIVLGTTTADATGHWTFAPVGLNDGSHTILASETDAAGNTSAASLTFTLDIHAPTPAITNESFSQSKLTLSGTTGEANDTVSIYDGSTLLGTTKTTSNGQWSFVTGKLSTSSHTITATATDAAGNVGQGGQDIVLVNSKGGSTLIASSGSDAFVFKAVSDSTPSSHDTIQNFNHVNDVIDFSGISGINSVGGIASFQGQLAGSGNLTLHAHSVGYIEVGGNTEVLINTSNSSETVSASNVHAANMEIVLSGIHLGLASSNFHLI
jgi:parallel beta-helix repeat protein